MSSKRDKIKLKGIWDLPDVLLFKIVSFVAAPTHRATVLCHQIAPLCKLSYKAILEEDSAVALWDTVLNQDYGGTTIETHQRASKRLRRTVVQRTKDAHKLITDNTEIAFYYLQEMVNSKTNKLSRSNFVRLLEEYGPHLRINRTVSSGGLYLVEICRAQHVTESVILNCVKELVENRCALVDLITNESNASSQTALCVAAARGMHKVVKYLLERGADREIISSGRFKRYTNPKKIISCRQKNALQFAIAMREAEVEAGAKENDIRGLTKCIKLLQA